MELINNAKEPVLVASSFLLSPSFISELFLK